MNLTETLFAERHRPRLYFGASANKVRWAQSLRGNGACGLGMTKYNESPEFSATVPYPGNSRGFLPHLATNNGFEE
jgi:hypothetical protein